MIRKAKLSDIEAIIDLEKKTLNTTLGKTFLNQEISENPFGNYFVYTIDEMVVAYIGFRVVDQKAEMMNFSVNTSYQNQKIGQTLLSYCISLFEKKGILSISLEVRKSNLIAQHVYKKMGFKLVHTKKAYYGHEDGYVYIKEVKE